MESVLLLIPCFLLQKEMEENEDRLSLAVERLYSLEAKLENVFTEIVNDQVSYVFVDCTIKFTLPYRLACS